MAKKRHNYQRPEGQVDDQSLEQEEMVSTETESQVEETPVVTEPEKEVIQTPAEAPATEEEEKVIEVAPKKEETKLDLSTPAELKNKPAPAEAPKKAETKPAAKPMSREMAELIKMLDMYKDMCKVRTMDPAKLRERMRVLFSIIRLVAPNSSSTSVKYSTRELVETLFNRMVEGSGTIFSDGYLFRLTYALPAQDAVKFEAFYSALLQLVNAKLRGAKITFSMDVLRDVLKNESVMAAIRSIRARFN